MKTIAAALIVLFLTAGSCEPKPQPQPANSTLCGTGPDGPIWCPVPTPNPMPTLPGERRP